MYNDIMPTFLVLLGDIVKLGFNEIPTFVLIKSVTLFVTLETVEDSPGKQFNLD